MAANVVCSYNRTGYCKFEDRCRNLHINEVCGLIDCSGDSCQLRHPRACRYYNSNGACKYLDKCAYSHKNLLFDEVTSIKRDMAQIVEKLELIQRALEKLTSCASSTDLAEESPSKSISSSQLETSLTQIPQVDGLEPCPPDPVPKRKYFPCQSCSLVFHSIEDLKWHDSYQFYCDICTICFATKKNLN